MYLAIDTLTGRIVATARFAWLAEDLALRKGTPPEAVRVVNQSGDLVEVC